MPGLDGFALAERIRAVSGASPVVMMLTSAGRHGDARRCKKLGITAYLLKPVGRNELLQAMVTALGHCVERKQTLITRHTLREGRRALRILVAEDNAVNQKVILRVLEKQGHKPELAQTGREALEMSAITRFDVILMDIQMPEMDGVTAAAAIRERERDTGCHVPIVALTAHAMKRDEEHCIAAGMDAYVSKPVDISQLQQVLDRVISQSPERAKAQSSSI
jgi:CheY-like chemotaxis protein